jgi:hypothetical protein
MNPSQGHPLDALFQNIRFILKKPDHRSHLPLYQGAGVDHQEPLPSLFSNRLLDSMNRSQE